MYYTHILTSMCLKRMRRKSNHKPLDISEVKNEAVKNEVGKVINDKKGDIAKQRSGLLDVRETWKYVKNAENSSISTSGYL